MATALPHQARACRHCGQALSALERLRGDHCGRLDCHRNAVDRRGAQERAAAIAQRLRAALRQGALAAVAQAPVLWLTAHTSRMTALPATLRRAHLQYLETLVRSAPEADDEAPAADPAPGSPVTGRVCGFCTGRCCHLGGERQAFLRRQQLVRWVAAHPGTTLADATADYARHLPRRHAQGSCVYHGPQGCTLPRDMRADICNTYLCEPLKVVRQRADEGAPEGSVLAMARQTRVLRAAWVTEDTTLPLTRRPRKP